jgi:hypothetical protein
MIIRQGNQKLLIGSKLLFIENIRKQFSMKTLILVNFNKITLFTLLTLFRWVKKLKIFQKTENKVFLF